MPGIVRGAVGPRLLKKEKKGTLQCCELHAPAGFRWFLSSILVAAAATKLQAALALRSADAGRPAAAAPQRQRCCSSPATTSRASMATPSGVLYKDEKGDFVVFDAIGPGCVRSIWQTCFPKDQVLKFYFDGETKPRYEVKTVDFYAGKHPDFPKPLVSCEILGYYARRRRHRRQLLRADPVRQVAADQHDEDGLVQSFPLRTLSLRHARHHVHRQGRSLLPASARSRSRAKNCCRSADAKVIRTPPAELKPGESREILNVAAAGNRVAESSSKATPPKRSCIRSRSKCIGTSRRGPTSSRRSACSSPVPFGRKTCGRCRRRSNCCPSNRIRLTSYFRMPFWRKGRIVLDESPVAGRRSHVAKVSAEVHLLPQRYTEADTGYFSALYRDGPNGNGPRLADLRRAGHGPIPGRGADDVRRPLLRRQRAIHGGRRRDAAGSRHRHRGLLPRLSLAQSELQQAVCRLRGRHHEEARPGLLLPLSSRRPAAVLQCARRADSARGHERHRLAVSDPRLLLSPQAARAAADRFHRRGQRDQRAAAQLPGGRFDADRRAGSLVRRQQRRDA